MMIAVGDLPRPSIMAVRMTSEPLFRPVLAALVLILSPGAPSADSGAVHPAYLRVEAFPPDPMVRMSDSAGWTIYLDGFIDAEAAPRLAEVIAQRQVSRATVYFNSPGGSLLAGMTLGRLLREHGYATDVGRRSADPRARPGVGVCYSACPFAFAGGVSRHLAAGSVLGVHRAANRVPVPDELAFEQLVVSQASVYLAAMGVGPELATMMTQVPNDQVRLLTREEARRLNLVTD